MTPMSTDKPKEKRQFRYHDALAVARELEAALAPACVPGRIMIAGSIRRRRLTVGDIELVYQPRVDAVCDLLNEPCGVRNHADERIYQLLGQGILAKRLNKLGRASVGSQIKLVVHVATGIPVDLFAANSANWWNLLVCRTGGRDTNIAIADAAKDIGLRWSPYGPGFQRPATGEVITVRSEAEVFEMVGLPYREPVDRE